MRRSLDKFIAAASLVATIVLAPFWSRMVWDYLLSLVPATEAGIGMLMVVFGFVFLGMLYSFHLLWTGVEKASGIQLYSRPVLPIVAVVCVVVVIVAIGGPAGIQDLVYWIVEVDLRYMWMMMHVNLLSLLMFGSLGILIITVLIDLITSVRTPLVSRDLKGILFAVWCTSAVLINLGYGNFHIGVTNVFIPRPIDEAKAGREPFEQQIVVSLPDFSPDEIRQFVDPKSMASKCASMPSHYLCK